MSEADRVGRGMDYLRPFLPGLESVLEDEDVSEIMINGPGNVWVESRGKSGSTLRPASMGLRSIAQPFRSLGPSASIRPAPRSLMPGWTMAPAWRSVSPRPRRTSPSPSGASASGAFRPRISCASAHCPRKCWTRRGRRSSGGGISWSAAGPDRVRPRCSMPWSSCSPPTTALFPSRTPWNSASTGKTVSASRRGGSTVNR